jgi:cytochrome c553
VDRESPDASDDPGLRVVPTAPSADRPPDQHQERRTSMNHLIPPTLAAVAALALGVCAPAARAESMRPLVIAQAATGADVPAKAELCVSCHGPEGNSPTGQFPVLAGQNARYLYLELKDFKEDRRKDPVMSVLVKDLSKQEMQALAQYFAAQKPKAVAFKPDPDKVAAGRKKADETLCTMCHLGGFSGQNEIPRVAGQWPEYVVKQLKDFKARTRTNDAGNMTSVANTLSDKDIENLSHYIGSLN